MIVAECLVRSQRPSRLDPTGATAVVAWTTRRHPQRHGAMRVELDFLRRSRPPSELAAPASASPREFDPRFSIPHLRFKTNHHRSKPSQTMQPLTHLEAIDIGARLELRLNENKELAVVPSGLSDRDIAILEKEDQSNQAAAQEVK